VEAGGVTATKRTTGGAGFLLLLSFPGFGQSAAPGRTFEVASVKPHEGPMNRSGVSTEGLRLDGLTTVRGLIMFAYGLTNRDVFLSGPPAAAVGDTFYDVVAKAEGNQPPTRDEFRQMLQSLLADRFKLKVHRETRETPVYELVVGKSGPKFKASATDADPMHQVKVVGRNYNLILPKATMGDLVGMLESAGFLGRNVVDKTGLSGTYDIKLTYTPDIRSNRENPDPGDIGILQAVEEQLGLKLEPQKTMTEVLVVDHAEKPTVN
jgi:uncharacterized protein (TIGR03435 family)